MWILSFENLHVSFTMGGNWVRVTAMMMKMIKGQMIRVKDQSCSKKEHALSSDRTENVDP